jgi:hypothetical protein
MNIFKLILSTIKMSNDLEMIVLCPIGLYRLNGLRLTFRLPIFYNLIYQRPKAEGLSKNRVAKNFGYRVEV